MLFAGFLLGAASVIALYALDDWRVRRITERIKTPEEVIQATSALVLFNAQTGEWSWVQREGAGIGVHWIK